MTVFEAMLMTLVLRINPAPVSFSSPFSRYSIERVFRPRKLDRAHPRELLECAFDIITPVTSSLLPDAETIYTISEIVQEFPVLQVKRSACVLNDPLRQNSLSV